MIKEGVTFHRPKEGHGSKHGDNVFAAAQEAGYVERIQRFGGSFLNDTCWCLIGEPIVPASARNIMTNSAKYAHYGAAAVERGFHFGSLAECVRAATTGHVETSKPAWLGA